MENTTEENMIYLKDLVFVALRRWKRALAMAVVFALILGGYKAASGWRSVDQNADQAGYNAAVEHYEAEKKALENALADRQRDVNNHMDLLANSVLMELDPYNHYQAKLSIYVDTDYQILPDMDYQTPDKAGYILNAYHAKLTDPQTLGTLAQSVQTEARYLTEVYDAKLPAGSNAIVVTVAYPTEAGAKALLEQLTSEVTQAQTQIAQTIGAHNIRILEQSVSLYSNLELTEKQKAAQQLLQDMQAAVEAAKMQVNTLAIPVASGVSAKEVVKDAIVFAIVGAIAAVALVVVCAWIGLIASQKVYSARSLRNRTGVKILGCVAKKLPRNPIDRWLLKLEGRELSAPKDRAEMLARDVHNRCDGVARLVITGSADMETRAFVTEALVQEMSGVQVVDCGSILYVSEAVDALRSCDKVLLVEQCASSRYDNVVEQRQKIADYGKELLGCILIDG